MSEDLLSKATSNLDVEIDKLKNLASKSINPCLVAQYIAITDSRVRQLFLQKIVQGNLFRGIKCLNQIGIPEIRQVLFQFDCPPGIFCLVNPSFLVIVNIVSQNVEQIIDPYIAGQVNLGSRTAPIARDKITLSGVFQQIFAPGGETTGTGLKSTIELDLETNNLKDKFVPDNSVSVTGFFTKVQGVETGERDVFVVEKIN